jgi:quercetin dioxygenase-like cupin family protein
MTNLPGVNTTAKEFRRRRLWRLGGAASAAALALGLIGSYAARAQLSGLQINALALGTDYDNNTVNLHVPLPANALQSLLVFAPGGETGWHYHPGPVVVVVKTGALTETHSDGCVTLHPAGSVFFETAGEIHNAANLTGVETDVYATFLFPVGTQPLIPTTNPNPGAVCKH